jgi:EmrB/QacA subfamily drug resistance transporter
MELVSEEKPAMTGESKSRVMGVVVVAVFMASLDLFIVNIAFPQISKDFAGTSLGSLSWVLNAYAIVFAALLIGAGRWSDAVGRKRAFLLGMGLFTAASAACAAAPSAAFLVGARALQAAGAALLMPASLGLLLPSFPPARRHVAIGVWAAVAGVAAAAGPPLGGLLVQASWRWVFLVNVPVGLVTLAVGWRALREIRHPDPIRADLVGAGILTLGIGAAIVAIVKGPDWGWTSAPIVALFVLALAMLGALVRRSTTHPAPIVEPDLLRVRAFRTATLGSLLFFVAFTAMLLASVLFLTEVWRRDILTTGLMIAPGPALAALFAIPGARLGARFGPGPVGAAGAALFALGGAIWLARLGTGVHYATDYLPSIVIGGAGVGLVLPSLTSAAVAALPPARLATGIAVQTTGRQIGSALGVAVLVAVLGTAGPAHDFAGAWTLMIISAVAAALTLARLGRAAEPILAIAPAEAATAAHKPTARSRRAPVADSP